MSKPSFLGATSPFLVDIIMERRPVEIEGHIRTGIQEGADAFGLQMEELMPFDCFGMSCPFRSCS